MTRSDDFTSLASAFLCAAASARFLQPRHRHYPTSSLVNHRQHSPHFAFHLFKYRCMNQLLFDRSTGILGPHAFARLQSSQLLHAIQPAPSLVFDGGEKEVAPSASPGTSTTENLDPQEGEGELAEKSWTHQAGVNALAIDIDGRMYNLLQPVVAAYLLT